MHNELDSRALGQADCFAQRFMRPGDYRYAVVPGYGHELSTDFPFIIHVEQGSKKKEGELVQHNVRVNADARGFKGVPASLTIGLGDMVLWNGGGGAPFAVVGEAEFFNSYRMVNECGFTHAFGTAGTFEWRDAFGSDLGGTIHVTDPDCTDMKKWHAALSEGTVVMIADGKVDPPELRIMTGQTVFFAIVTTAGVSITDARLIDQPWMHPHCDAADRPNSRASLAADSPAR